jgi:hypothetical protein
MAFRSAKHTYSGSSPVRAAALLACATSLAMVPCASAQVFVVGEKTAMADVSTDFHPTKIELSDKPINERVRRELIRDLEDEQGFAHRVLPLADNLTLMANGNLVPGGDAYKEMIYKKGQSAGPGDRVIITAITFKPDRIVFDINGGPYLKHRFLRHVELNGTPIVPDDGAQVSGCRITLIFEGGVPEISAPEVKALLDPVIDFGVKTSAEAYADAMPPFLKKAIEQHDVLVGMNRRMLLAAMGAPESKVRELVPGSADRHYEEWLYGRVPQTVRFVRIENDRVIQVRIAALGQPIAVKTENELQGFLDPADQHEIAMGDTSRSNNEDERSKGAPTLRKPGDPVPPGGSQRVQYPVPGKEQPLPAAPGSPADPNAGADPVAISGVPLDNNPGMLNTPGSPNSSGYPNTPGSSGSRGSTPSNGPIGAPSIDGSYPGDPTSRVN